MATFPTALCTIGSAIGVGGTYQDACPRISAAMIEPGVEWVQPIGTPLQAARSDFTFTADGRPAGPQRYVRLVFFQPSHATGLFTAGSLVFSAWIDYRSTPTNLIDSNGQKVPYHAFRKPGMEVK